MSYYEDLGVTRRATQDEIEKAYRALAQKYHPDKHPGSEQQSAAAFKRIQEAFQVLRNSRARAAYDETLRAAESPADDPILSGTNLAVRSGHFEQPRHRSDERAQPHKSVLSSRPLLIGLGAVLLIAAAMATVTKRPPSAEEIAAKQESEAAAKAKTLEEQNRLIEAEKAAAKRKEESVVAKAKLQAVQVEGKWAFDIVNKLEEEINSWDQNVPPLLTNEKGKMIAAHDEGVRLFNEIWNKKRPTKVDVIAARERIKILLMPVDAELLKEEVVWSPDDSLKKQIETEEGSLAVMLNDFRVLRGRVDFMIEETQRAGKTSTLTLQDAIKDRADHEAAEKNRRMVEISEQGKAKLQAAEEARLKEQLAQDLRVKEAEKQALVADADNSIEHKKLLARAKSSGTRTLLAFFLTPGYVQPLRQMGTEK